MALTYREIAAPADAVWAVLADGWLYSYWVVGTTKIRDVEPAWPRPGSKLHHAVGAWPLALHDETEILEWEPGRRLVMQARGWPMGEARVDVRLQPHGDVTVVEIEETPTSGPGAWVHNPVLDAIGRRRLVEMLDRLGRLVEGHQRAGSATG